jgi:hypothetical protein
MQDFDLRTYLLWLYLHLKNYIIPYAEASSQVTYGPAASAASGAAFPNINSLVKSTGDFSLPSRQADLSPTGEDIPVYNRPQIVVSYPLFIL